MPDRTSSELDPDEIRGMLSELRGTPLRGAGPWDAEAATRLAAFQRAEGLPPTGSPDNVTVDRIRLRFEGVIAARAEGPHKSPSPEAHNRVVGFLQTAVHAAQHVASELSHDAPIRELYIKETREYAADILQRFERGAITEGEAAHLASKFRNQCLQITREGLSPAGQALSRFVKEQGTTIPALFEKYAGSMYGKPVRALTVQEQSSVCVRIAERSGATNEIVNGGARLAPTMGRALIAAAIVITIYQVATAEDSVGEAVKQGAGLAGFWAGAELGAYAGVACGPAAWICVPVGGLVGGVAGSLLAEKVADVTYQSIKG